jgi:hypothetical protein
VLRYSAEAARLYLTEARGSKRPGGKPGGPSPVNESPHMRMFFFGVLISDRSRVDAAAMSFLLSRFGRK